MWKLAAKWYMVLHWKPPCFGGFQAAIVANSFHGKYRLVCKQLQITHQAVVKLWKVQHKSEKETVSLQSKSCREEAQVLLWRRMSSVSGLLPLSFMQQLSSFKAKALSMATPDCQSASDFSFSLSSVAHEYSACCHLDKRIGSSKRLSWILDRWLTLWLLSFMQQLCSYTILS